MLNPVRIQANRYLFFAAVLTTLAVSPWFSLDPINLPKMVALVVSGFMAFMTVLPSLKFAFGGRARWALILGILFILQLTIVLFVDDSPLSQQFFGTFGRNTGYLSYLALALVFVVAAISMDRAGATRLVYGLLLVGVFNAGYGLMQFFGADPINWSNPYNSILGTLGNPNFASSLLGMAAIASLAWAFGKAPDLVRKALGVGVSILALFLAYESDSIQGVAIALVGFSILGYQVLSKVLGWRWARIPYLGVVLSGFVLSVMGALQKGPLSSLIYQASVTYRGDYWRAGIEMTKDYPVFGVGLDSYGDYYRAYRAIEAVERRGPDITANSAHNVFIDISSTGGLPLLLIYLLILAFAFRSAFRLLASAKSFDWVAVSLVGAWAAYLAQSAISINQLGLAVWGWVLPGAIIGLDLNRDLVVSGEKRGPTRRSDLPAKNYLSGVLGGIVGLVVVIWPFNYDAGFRNAVEAGDPQKIIAAAQAFPKNNYQINFAANAFVENKLEDNAQLLFRLSTENNPRDFYAWQGVSNSTTIAPEERAKILETMRSLDPLNPNIPKQ